MNIILCGLPNSGKTTLGKSLASLLNYNFIDLDRLIENRYVQETLKPYTCKEIYTVHGERKFRELEKLAIASIKSVKNSVISVGGGSFEDKDNIYHLKSIGFIIYLKASFKTLLERFETSNRSTYLDKTDIETTFWMVYQKRIHLL